MKICDLLEMAQPSQIVKEKTYYHGTKFFASAQSILKNGIHPPDLSKRSGYLKPVEGKVYITDDIGYAIMYAIGGNFAGTDHFQRSDYFWEQMPEKYGYLFVIDGVQLVDVQPDEDSVGEFLRLVLLNDPNAKNHYKLEGINNAFKKALDDQKLVQTVFGLANTHLANSTLKRVKDGEYIYYAKSGKVLLKRLSDSDKLKMVEYGFHVAHGGAIFPKQAWRLSLRKVEELNRDGSNFFQLAEQIA